jgi:uncharacterized protein (TIGR03790 family)
VASVGLWVLLPVDGHGLGPHEVLLLVNEESPASIEVGEAFAALRSVPTGNIVRGASHISREDFTAHIWTPAIRAVRERGLDDQILAWVYSVDFPTGVGTGPLLSLTGQTFLRNRPADPQQVKMGTYESPLFAGPNGPHAGAGHLPQTFDAYREWLGKEMPLPSMVLGFVGERGNDPATVMATLRRGAASDHTAPTGVVLFVTGEDVRAQCRHWQFEPTRRELRRLGVNARVVNGLSDGAEGVMGVLMGAADVAVPRPIRFRPGAMAEHLTSLAAVFHTAGQTKLTEWFRLGATASSGTVTEPYSIWSKFPHARFFVHYASGCTMMESFFQSVRCPLQTLIVGEPLAQPWAPRAEVWIRGTDGDVSGRVEFQAGISGPASREYGGLSFLLDGKAAGPGPILTLDTRTIGDGAHSIRAVARRRGCVRSQVFRERTFRVRNAEGGAAARGVGPPDTR